MSSELIFFQQFRIQPVTSAEWSDVLADPAAHSLTILFLWGRDCPNCDIAKRAMLLGQDRLVWPDVRWLHCNVYDDPDMATRFGLHGIPVFLVFHGRRSSGRITSWPGLHAFVMAIERQRVTGNANASRSE